MLPAPPPTPPPIPGNIGPQANPGATPGLSPYPIGVGPQVAQSIGEFVKSFLQAKLVSRDHFDQKFEQGIQSRMLGIPIPDEQLMKYAKKSGKYRDLRTEPPTPQEIQFQQAQQLAQAGPVPGMPGAAESAAQVPPPTPAPPPSLMQQALQSRLGFRAPQVSMQSPVAQWLGNLTRAVGVGGGLPGAVARQGASANIGLDDQALGNLSKALGVDVQSMDAGMKQRLFQLGADAFDPKSPKHWEAMEMLQRGGILGKLPIDDTISIARAVMPNSPLADIKMTAGQMHAAQLMGVPQMRLAMFNGAKEMVDRFLHYGPNALQAAMGFMMGDTRFQPSMTPKELQEKVSALARYQEGRPDAPAPLLEQMATADALGLSSIKDTLMKQYTQFPTSGTKEQTRFSQRLGFDYTSLAQSLKIHNDNLTLGSWEAVQKELGEEAAPFIKTMENEKLSKTERETAAKSLAAIASKRAYINLPYRGQEMSVSPLQAVQQQWSMHGGGDIMRSIPGVQVPPAPPNLYSLPKNRQAMQNIINYNKDPNVQRFLDMMMGPPSAEAEQFQQEGEALRKKKEIESDVLQFLRGVQR